MSPADEATAPRPSAAQRFAYVARDASSQRVTGAVEAADETAARRALRAEGLYPIRLSPLAPGAPAPAGRATLAPASAVRRLRLSEATTLIESLARLVGRQVSLERALHVVSERPESRTGQAAAAIRQAVREGGSFAEAVAARGGLVDPAALALIRAGEASGDMAGALSSAASVLQGRLAAARLLSSKLLYPGLLFSTALASVLLILIVIVPQFRPLVAERFDLVPPIGQAIFALSGLLETAWPLILAGLVLAGLAAAVLARSGRLARVATRIAERLPLFGEAVRETRAMLALRILGALVERRVALSQALRIVAEAAYDPVQQSALKSATLRVENGEALWSSLAAEKLAPRAAIEMVRIGEEAGALGAMLSRAADDLEEGAERRAARVFTVLEPALIVGVGGIVGLSFYALFTAITAVNAINF